jgi:predicted deacetylase
VALHDVEPHSVRRCALIRDWLADLGVDRVTLLVVPAPRLRPFFQSSPELAAWLRERRDAGDAIAQHGFTHARHGGRSEFPALSRVQTREKLAYGRRLLAMGGIDVRGFVAPAYATTPALRQELTAGYDWWATPLRVRSLVGVGSGLAPVVGFDHRTRSRRIASRSVVRVARTRARGSLRLDLHPADFDRPGDVLAIERLLRRAEDRPAVTYDDLAARP